MSTDYCKIAAWVDRQYIWWGTMGLPVEPPESIVGKMFDKVLLTAETENVANSMRRDVLEFGVPSEKIYWQDDYLIRENIAHGFDRERILREAKGAILVRPTDYISLCTLDIVIRVMYARDILLNNNSEHNRNLYRKLAMSQNNGEEPTNNIAYAYFTEYSEKKGWAAFDNAFRSLVISIRDNGFCKEHFIPLDSEGTLINGRHRLAAAIANEMLVWVRRYPFSGFHFCFDENKLETLGFSDNEIQEIILEYKFLSNEK